MKTIDVAELKAHLSEYLRRVRNGERIIIRDRKALLAELVPLRSTEGLWQRLARERGVKLGTQSREPVKPLRTRKRIDWLKHLRGAQRDTW